MSEAHVLVALRFEDSEPAIAPYPEVVLASDATSEDAEFVKRWVIELLHVRGLPQITVGEPRTTTRRTYPRAH